MNNSSISTDEYIDTLTLDAYKLANFIIYQIIIPTVALIGVVGNILSFLVLVENKAKNAFATYLKALTLADTGFLLGAFVRFVLSICRRYISTNEVNKIEIYGELWFARRIGSWLQQLNSAFVAIIAFERFMSVVFPLKVKQFVIDRHPIRVVIAIMVLHMVAMLPVMFVTEVRTVLNPYTNCTSYYIGYTDFGMSILEYYFIFVCIVKYIIPFIIVVFTTTVTVIYLRKRIVKNDTTQGKQWCMERDRMTTVLIAIATFFVCSTIYSVAMSVIVIFFPDFARSHPLVYAISGDILFVLVCLNCANDFLIYIVSSTQFRKLFVSKFLFCRRQESRDGHTLT